MAQPAKRGKNEPEPRPIIIKKIIADGHGGHHGGAWKVAYADFVTAMMAFFLLLWLLGSTTEAQRRGLADYFTPTLVKLKEQSAGSDGLLGGASLTDPDNYPHRAAQTGNRLAITIPRDASGGAKAGATQINRMRERLEQKVQASPHLRHLMRQVRMVDTTEGTRIDLVDDADFSMFALGTTVLTPDARTLLGAIAQTVAPEAGLVTIRGHTDALPWKSGVQANNWSLSAGRAEATRQQLMRDGIGERRFRRIEGVADRELLIADHPEDPRNRRMSILLTR